MLRTGILLPRSTLFPSLGLELLNGLKENLKTQNVFDHIKLVTDNIGFGIDEQDIYSKAEKMLLQEDADLVILCADTRIAEMLQPLFAASNKILLVVNFGANFPDSWQPAPTTITHSLNFCMHASLTGKLAALETNKQAVNVISYYDGGYRQCFCMLNSHQVNGGIPRYNHITNINLNEFSIEPVAAFLKQSPDVNSLLCLFSGDQAERFYREASPLQKEFDLNLYVSPMMLDESLKNYLGNKFNIGKVRGFIPWHSSLNNESNSLFKKSYTSSTGHPVNYFSLLGWETGMLLNEILRLNNTGNTNATSVVNALSEISFDSPRGWMKIDAATQYSYGPSYLAACKSNMEISVGNETEKIDEEWTAFTKAKLPPGESSSWRNTYLCI
jgi:branched-chain amino acid transport system substrate-binding protein